MKASEWLKTVPAAPGAARDKMFLDAIYAGDVVVDWCTVVMGPIELRVSTDVLQVGEPGDSVRINVSANSQQKIADWFGCVLPTAKICDAIYDQAKYKLGIHNLPPDNLMAHTFRMVKHSQLIDDELNKQGCVGLGDLRADCGKDWVLTKKLENVWKTKPQQSCNYGWHNTSSGEARADGKPGKVIQGCGYMHNWSHSDYSQNCRLIYNVCNVNGQEQSLTEAYKDTILSKILCHDGALTLGRMLGVPYEDPQQKLLDMIKNSQ